VRRACLPGSLRSCRCRAPRRVRRRRGQGVRRRNRRHIRLRRLAEVPRGSDDVLHGPRLFELIDALPKSPTQRLQNLLRACRNGPATWDREVKGYKVTRNGPVTESP